MRLRRRWVLGGALVLAAVGVGCHAEDPVAVGRRALVARYAENEAGFFASDPDRVMRLRHVEFHAITPDGKVSDREQMYERTRQFNGGDGGAGGGSGGSGGSGGVHLIAAGTIVNSASGIITVVGGAGGEGGRGGDAPVGVGGGGSGGGGGGGGEGGNGGLIYRTFVNQGQIRLDGGLPGPRGAAGTGGAGGTGATINGAAGANGVAGPNGASGNAGVLFQIKL